MKRGWLKVVAIAIIAAFFAIACAAGCDDCKGLSKEEKDLAKAFGITACPECNKKL